MTVIRWNTIRWRGGGQPHHRPDQGPDLADPPAAVPTELVIRGSLRTAAEIGREPIPGLPRIRAR